MTCLQCFTIRLSLVCVMVIVASSQPQNCGKRKVSNLLILGGTEAKEGFWPWHAALFLKNFRSFEYKCGGTVLDKNLILTAAHCVMTPKGPIKLQWILVQVGRSRLSVANRHVQEHAVNELIIHPEFNKGKNVAHDIALVKLTTNIIYSDYVQPICLWNRGDDQDSIVGSMGTVIGFGYDETDNVTDTLREARMPIVDLFACASSNVHDYAPVLTADMICAGNRNGISPCNGDGGEGLFFNYNDVWYIRGLASFKKLRQDTLICDPTEYMVFTDVAKYLSWIANYVQTKAVVPTTLAAHALPCGKRKVVNFLNKNGTLIKEGYWPWHATLLKKRHRSFDYECGGTILTQTTILTVAHCVMTSKQPIALHRLLVQVGRSQLYVESQHAQQHKVDELIVHPEYNASIFTHNIALVKLDTEITYTDYVQPVCLWNRGDDLHSILGSRGTVVGFSYDEDEEGTDTLRDAHISVVDTILCIQRDWTQVSFKRISKMVCAGNLDGITPCLDEIGNGLFFNFDNVWYIRGLMSTPKHRQDTSICDSNGYTLVTDVAKYLSWIAKNLDLKNNLPISVEYNEPAPKGCRLRC